MIKTILKSVSLSDGGECQEPTPADAPEKSAVHPAIQRLIKTYSDLEQSLRSLGTEVAQSPRSDPLTQWRSTSRRTFMVVALFSVLVNVLMLTMPIYLFQISDRVLTSRSVDTLLMLSGLALGLLATMSMLDVLRRQILGRLAASMEVILGGPLLAGIVMSAPTGEGGSVQALRSLHQVRNFLSSPTMLLLFDAPLSPFYFGVIFLIHPDLGAIVLTAGLVLSAIAFLNQTVTAGPMGKAGDFASRADSNAESLARNAQVINAMGMLNEGILHWGRERAQALSLQINAHDKNFWISGASKFARLVTQIAILGWGAHLALAGFLTGGMMIAASIIAGRALQPLEGMIEGWRSLVQARASYARVRTMLESLRVETPKLRLPRPTGRLSVERLLYIPPGSREPILNGINFELSPGDSLAIIGPSGSGKSTLARILVGCQLPTAGRVRLDGTELRNWDRRQFGAYTGYLPQEVELFPGTIKENICRLRTDLSDNDIYDAASVAGVHDMVCQFPAGYETILDRNGAPLSGGQKQRIALARAFFGNPSFIVLDEPNSNLDAMGEQALAESMQKAKARGVTMVLITQRPALAHSVDKVLILRGGLLEHFGPPQDVLHRIVHKKSAAAAVG